MSVAVTKSEKEDRPLLRRFGLLQAIALNMSNMIGVGPFITIPLLMSALGGPQAMLGWVVAVLIAIPDGMVWSELGAAMPDSGGSYVYLREAYGRVTFGRLMAFLFIWQFILSGPLKAYAGSRYRSTGVIQWMLNNAWPSMIWHLYDYYLMPGGGYFGTRKACEPVHVQYSYADRSVIAVNSTQKAQRDLRLTAQVYDINLAIKFSKVVQLDLSADSNSTAFVIPPIPDLSETYFLRLLLEDNNGQAVSSNFYWLSARDDVLDWQKSTWYYTPTSSFADMTQLQELQPVKLEISARATRNEADEIANIRLSNPSQSMAFFVHLQIKHGLTERNVLPVIWQDNYFSMLPGESRDVTATYHIRDLDKYRALLAVDGWNISPGSASIIAGRKR